MPVRACEEACCVMLAPGGELTAGDLVAATAKSNPFGSNETSIGGGPAGRPAEGVPTGVATSPVESGDGDSLSAPMPPLGALSLSSLPNVVWKGSECSAQEMRSWRGSSVVSRDVSLPCVGVASGQRSCCPASRSDGPRTRPCGFVAGGEGPAAARCWSCARCSSTAAQSTRGARRWKARAERAAG